MNMHLSIIAGLGNPDERYERTLHNAGFWFADAVAAAGGGQFRYEKKFDAEVCKVDLAGGELRLVKPQSYMNLSGGPIRAVLDYYRLAPETLLVAHDEIDLPPGVVRLKKGGGHGGHNGVRDTIRHCGNEFMRLRLGVGHPGTKEQVTGYVLKQGPVEVEESVRQAIAQALDVLPLLAESGLAIAMNRLHTKSDGN
ncbi:MAG TPA: aminoacyl-tRNA hydrolase [Woeseiaceae bacterium]|nr:aminoacyl-tRNA hydrolase [Woeseiaceae bacterium]